MLGGLQPQSPSTSLAHQGPAMKQLTPVGVTELKRCIGLLLLTGKFLSHVRIPFAMFQNKKSYWWCFLFSFFSLTPAGIVKKAELEQYYHTRKDYNRTPMWKAL